jgi:hypothetical protein
MIKTLTGGCQCGRIRYAATIANDDAYLCHCRMCQRATGGFAASFVHVPIEGVTWQREPDWYQSSRIAHRPFCSACGTPLGFAYLEDAKGVDLTLGSFDDPSAFVPTEHSGAESMHEAWLDTSTLPRQTSAETASVAGRWKAAGLEVPE